MKFELSKKERRASLFAGALGGAVLLFGFTGHTSSTEIDSQARKQVPTNSRYDREVRSDQFAAGIRVTTFKPQAAEVLTQVVELCDDGNLIKQAKYIQGDAQGRYVGDGLLKVVRDAQVCSDDRITQADEAKLGVPAPPPAPPLLPPVPKIPHPDLEANPASLS